MFTTTHFVWVGICVALVLAMLFAGRKFRLSLRAAGGIMTAICAFSETVKIMKDMVYSDGGGMHLNPLALPFHLCSIMMFCVVFITFGKEGKVRQAVIDFIAVVGTLSSVFALMIPVNGVDFSQLIAYQFFVYHGGLLWFSLYLIVGGYARLGLRSYARNIGLLLALVYIILNINGAMSAYGANFMFLVRPPMKNLPFLNLNDGWYAYFTRIIGLGLALITAFQLPFMLSRRKNKAEGG